MSSGRTWWILVLQFVNIVSDAFLVGIVTTSNSRIGWSAALLCWVVAFWLTLYSASNEGKL